MDAKIVWRRGGLRTASAHWNSEEGWTGFLDGNRFVEEPNSFSIVSKKLFSDGYCAYVSFSDPILETAFCTDHESTVQAIANAHKFGTMTKITWFKINMTDQWMWISVPNRFTAREIEIISQCVEHTERIVNQHD